MRFFRMLGFVLLLAAIAAVAVAGPQRMLLPEWFGFLEIAPNIFAPEEMRPAERRRAVEIVEASEKVVAGFFGKQSPRPNIILCPDTACDDVFGDNGARGVAYGRRVVRLGDGGINLRIAAHELFHTALKAEVGEWRAAAGAVPAWFDEGLAVIVSRDDRFGVAVSKSVLADLKARSGWWLWGALVKEHGSRTAYSGARMLVADIEREIGRDGLLMLIERVRAGELFDMVLEDLSAG